MTATGVSARPFERKIIARNNAASSANVIHADEGARAMGFAAALVPGTALYCYLESVIRGSLGTGWAERGAVEVRFTAPAHDGDRLTAAAVPSGAGAAVEAGAGAALEAGAGAAVEAGAGAAARAGAAVAAAVRRDETGQVAATARAWLLGPGDEPPDAAAYPQADLPDQPPPFSEAWALDAGELGSLRLAATPADIGEFLAGIGEPPDLFGADVPSAFLSRSYARLMSENVVRSSPSIHTASSIRHFRRVALGEPLSVRGHIDRLYGRRGNRYYVLDMAYIDERGDVVMAQRHTGIYRPRPRTASPSTRPT